MNKRVPDQSSPLAAGLSIVTIACMAAYQILPDDRGWPMAHEVRADDSVAQRACGSLMHSSPVWMDIAVNNVLVRAAKVTVLWFAIDGEPELIALGWEIESAAPALALLTTSDRAVAVNIAGRPATAAWCGPGRVMGVTRFPFTRDEWMAMGPPADMTAQKT